MPDQLTKPERFKTAQPRIPGVPEPAPEEPREDTLAPPFDAKAPVPIPTKWVAGAAGIIVLGLGILWWNHFRTPAAAPTPQQPADLLLQSLPPGHSVQKGLPVGPGPIATTEDLAKPWAARKFNFKDQLTGELTPATVVHLPGGIYWAFSLHAPFGSCELEYVTDLAKLDTQYGYKSDHPMVADPCSRAVYDLTRYGTGPNGLVRGEIVQGAGVRPPVAIEVRVEGHQIVAVRAE
jgi:hypothetical protein